MYIYVYTRKQKCARLFSMIVFEPLAIATLVNMSVSAQRRYNCGNGILLPCRSVFETC